MAFNNKLKGELQSAEEIFRQKMAEKKVDEAKQEEPQKEKVREEKTESMGGWGWLGIILLIITIIRFIMWIF